MYIFLPALLTDEGEEEVNESMGNKTKHVASVVLKGTAPKKEKAVAPLKIKLTKKKKRKKNSVGKHLVIFSMDCMNKICIKFM